ncbi:hypothetical protein [Variibacter gotjawalensis]|uniref:hypothetical protein n=1 Tax=Variibacter gotjawalensis TaxID=1333996 RepID=UPI000BBB19F2|nr:hypothetical protein [Variibacter gotjawalensis]NIK46525.1 hypothetical protein [Variibacter gotjawalensis]
MTTKNEGAETAYQKALRILDAYRRSLVHADASDDILRAYSAILRHLRSEKVEQAIERDAAPKNASATSVVIPPHETVAKLTLEEVERLANDENSPRKLLEALAVARFGVPKGSLRSFSNIASLKERIFTHIQNERTHQTISSVAREQKR